MNVLYILLLVTFIDFHTYRVACHKMQLGRYEKKENNKLVSYEFETEAYSVIDCSIQCKSSLGDLCYSFAFSKSKKLCRGSELPAVADSSGGSEFAVYTDADECDDGNHAGCELAPCLNTGGSFSCDCNSFPESSMGDIVQAFIGDVTASISTQYYGSYDYGPHTAIDGITYFSWSSLTVTLVELSPWFQLDFTTSHCVFSVQVFSDVIRSNVRVTVGEEVSNVKGDRSDYICAYNHGPASATTFTLTCQQRMYGKLIRITTHNTNDELRLQEVQVFGW